MNKLLLIILIFFGSSYEINSQINIKSGTTENGIIIARDNGMNIGYDFSKSEARFIYGKAQSEIAGYLKMMDGKLIEINQNFDYSNINVNEILDTIYKNPFIGSNFKLAIPITEGRNALFSKGAYNPGIELSYEFIRNKDEFKNKSKYNFTRIGYELIQNKFGSISSTDSIIIENKVSQSVNITPGINWILSTNSNADNLIIAFSTAIKYEFNPVSEMKTKDFIIIDTLASNGSIQKTEKAYPEIKENIFSIQPKLDFVWTPMIQKDDNGNETGPRIGIIGSISSKFNISQQRNAWSFSIGPSIHPKWSSSNITSSIQFEFIDFNNSTKDKNIDDIFSVNFYVGIPLQLK